MEKNLRDYLKMGLTGYLAEQKFTDFVQELDRIPNVDEVFLDLFSKNQKWQNAVQTANPQFLLDTQKSIFKTTHNELRLSLIGVENQPVIKVIKYRQISTRYL